MNWNKWFRQTHRRLSIVTSSVAAGRPRRRAPDRAPPINGGQINYERS